MFKPSFMGDDDAGDVVREVQGENDAGPLLSMEQLERVAEASGRRLRLQTLGPFYRIFCCTSGEPYGEAVRRLTFARLYSACSDYERPIVSLQAIAA